MNSAGREWSRQWAAQSQMKYYQTGVQRFSNPKNTDQMLKNLIGGHIGRVEDQLARLRFSPGSAVLDVGAGPGTLSVPLAAAGCRVTAVEPAVPMHAALNEYKAFQGADADIPILPILWEEANSAEIGRFDYVVSSFALSFSDIEAALLKMDEIAEKEVHIFWFLTAPPWECVSAALWEELHHEKYCRRPTADLVWRALYEAGIYADLEVLPLRDSHFYQTVDEAVDEYAERLFAKDDRQIQVIAKYMEETLCFVPGKGMALPESGRYAHISWRK